MNWIKFLLQVNTFILRLKNFFLEDEETGVSGMHIFYGSYLKTAGKYIVVIINNIMILWEYLDYFV